MNGGFKESDMSIRSWLEKRRHKREENPTVTPEDVIRVIERNKFEPLPPPQLPSWLAEAVQQQPLDSPFGSLFGIAGLQAQQQQQMSAMMARMAAPIGCVGSCQPYRADPSICNTVSPRERKHVDSVTVPQKCLPAGTP